jgi:hypothetical protein
MSVQPWKVTLRSGATVDLLAYSQTHALLSAAELMAPDVPVRASRRGEW